MIKIAIPAICLLAAMVYAPPAYAQRDDVPIESKRLAYNNAAILEKLKPLRESGKLLSINDVNDALLAPKPQAIKLIQPSTDVLRASDLATHGRKTMLRIGWSYLCNKCSNWHLKTSNGYALTADGVVASCYHVLEADAATMREGYAFAMNTAGDVFPITSILAADKTMDAVVFRVEGAGFTPLALNDQVSPGDAAFLFSDPKEYAGYFSSGMINRFYWDQSSNSNDRDTLSGIKHLRIDVSTDWAPGSSGAAILDACGNAIGHVSTIQGELAPVNNTASGRSTSPSTAPSTTQATREEGTRPTYIVFHQGIPARGLRLLVESMNDNADRSAAKEPEN